MKSIIKCFLGSGLAACFAVSASAQAHLTFSGGSGEPLSITLTAPITYTVSPFPWTDPDLGPYFVFERVGNILPSGLISSGLEYSINDGPRETVNQYASGLDRIDFTEEDLVGAGPNMVQLWPGDVITLFSGTITTYGPFAAAAPPDGFYDSYIATENGDRLSENGDSVSPYFFFGSGNGGTIPQGAGSNSRGIPFVSTVYIPESFDGQISNVWLHLDGLDHNFAGALAARLVHPNGVTSIDLFQRPGWGTGNSLGYDSAFAAVNRYTFSDSGTPLFNMAPPPIIPSGTYLPSSNPNTPGSAPATPYMYTPTSFAETFNGMSASGTWTLIIESFEAGNTGSLAGWTLTFESPRPTPFRLTLEHSTDLKVWTPVEITPEMLTEEGAVDHAVTGTTGFFRMRIE